MLVLARFIITPLHDRAKYSSYITNRCGVLLIMIYLGSVFAVYLSFG